MFKMFKINKCFKTHLTEQCRQFSTPLLFGSFLQSGNSLFLRLTSCAWSCKRTDTRDHHLLICCHQAQFSLVWQTFHKSWRRPWEESFFNFSSISWEKILFRSSNISLVCTSASLLLTDRFKVEMESNLSLVCTSRYHSEVNLIENCKKFYLPQTALIGFKFCRKWKFSILAALWSLPLVLVLPSPEQNKRIIETISTSTATIAIFIFL